MSATISDAGRLHLRMALTDGVGPLTFSKLCNAFGGADEILRATAGQLQQVPRIGPETASAILRGRDETELNDEISAAEELGVRIVARPDADYPPGLRRIPDAPIVLYVKGELRETDAIAVAIVGSRRCTIYGSEQARRFAELLAGAGLTIVSGLARGIDAFAHHGALDAGGRTIAVMGAGLNDIYPPENRTLADRILEPGRGAWISGLPLRAAVRAANFPARNRIIAGMTLGTLVVEAADRSGALITARLASEYNREVFAVPGRVQDPTAKGTNALIRKGEAKLVAALEDVLEELGELGRKMMPREAAAPAAAAAGGGRDGDGATLFERRESPEQAAKPARPPAAPLAPLGPAESRVYEIIGYEPLLQDVVIRAAELPVGEVLAAFTTLELKGLVRRLPGQLIVRRGTA